MTASKPKKTVLALAAALVTACASGPTFVRPLTGVNFAPTLGVDLSAMTKAPKGFYYRDLRTGDGALVQTGQTVSVYYTGWLSNGREFDKAVAPAKPIEFRVGRGRVIDGWDEGVVGMRVGGERLLVVPYELGYGLDGRGPIPGEATLVFRITVLSAKQ
jgi:FKBP-type peptidyl-prolyl cis-trans isomerase